MNKSIENVDGRSSGLSSCEGMPRETQSQHVDTDLQINEFSEGNPLLDIDVLEERITPFRTRNRCESM